VTDVSGAGQEPLDAIFEVGPTSRR
jgi:hypothetical protein